MSPQDLAAQLEQLHAAAFGWALSCCGWDRPAAEDVLQASYLKILDGRARFDGRSGFRTWAFGVTRRTAQEARRRAAWGRWLPLTRLLFGPEAAEGRPGFATRSRAWPRAGSGRRSCATGPGGLQGVSPWPPLRWRSSRWSVPAVRGPSP